MDSFFELLKHRRSIRKYQSKEVEPEKIDLITKAALMSPASKRTNPWEFIIVREKNMLQQLSESRTHGSQLLSGAPLAIVVIANTQKTDVWMEDASIAAIIMQLQAQDLGLGSCWVQIYGRAKDDDTSTEDYIRQLLDIPQNYAVLSIISIGYPDEEKNSHDENRLQTDKVHNEKFLTD